MIIALPLELDHEQNKELIQAFAERMTEGRAAWAAGIHDGPGDADNPHAHIIFRDRDYETGKRVMLTTEKGSTQRFRDGWEQEANIALERAGRDESIDKRSLADQGIDREAQIHVGPGAQRLGEREYEFRSTAREVTRIIDGQPTTVTINYPVIDEGKTRFEENEERKQRNLERAFPENYMGPVNLPDGKPDRQEILESIHKADLRLAMLYQLITRVGEDGVPDSGHDALYAMALEHYDEQKDRGMFSRDKFPRHERRAPEGDKEPQRDVADAIGGAGLKIIGRIAQSIESLFDGTPTRERGNEEHTMADDKKLAQRTVEQQQKQSEIDMAASRRSELEAFLQQRDRERHIDRGR